MSQRKPRTRAEAKQAQASRTPASRSSRRGVAASTGRPRRRKWLLRGLWTVLALGAPRPRRARRRLRAHRHPGAQRDRDGAGVDHLLRRRQDRAGPPRPTPRATASPCRCPRCPTTCRRRMLAAEDQDFYQNNGISPTGIARAVWVAVKGGQATQGGSTITQQYVKNYFLTQDRTLTRKAREILISVKIDQQQTKDEILENYLNTIYYGRGAYGIQTASKAYFNKDVSQADPGRERLPRLGDPRAVALRPGPGRGAAGQRRGALGLHPRRDGREGLAQPGRRATRRPSPRSASTSRASSRARPATSPR